MSVLMSMIFYLGCFAIGCVIGNILFKLYDGGR